MTYGNNSSLCINAGVLLCAYTHELGHELVHELVLMTPSTIYCSYIFTVVVNLYSVRIAVRYCGVSYVRGVRQSIKNDESVSKYDNILGMSRQV
jgi:hypothetical protein